jgi:predicted nucleotidyltransferase
MEILTKELPFLKREYGVVKCGFFGSYSRDQMRVDSDML